jgi:HAD superfamily hydrolase (TIGR01509 family)
MIEAVIFDVDGTLVDTVDSHAEAWRWAFAEFGKEVAFADVRQQIGKGGDQLMPVFLSKDELEDFGKKLEKRRGEIFDSEYMPKAKPFPMVRELCERIKKDGKKIALASSATDEEIEFFKKLLNIGDLLEAETTSEDADQSKPEPDIFAAALEKLGSPDPARCVVVGDTPYDAIAAGKIKLTTVGVLSGGFPENQLRDAGCVEIYDDPADMLARYDDSVIGR